MIWPGRPRTPSYRRFGIGEPPAQTTWWLSKGDPQSPIHIQLGDEGHAWILGWFTYKAKNQQPNMLSLRVKCGRKQYCDADAQDAIPDDCFELWGEITVICRPASVAEDIALLKREIRKRIHTIIAEWLADHPEGIPPHSAGNRPSLGAPGSAYQR